LVATRSAFLRARGGERERISAFRRRHKKPKLGFLHFGIGLGGRRLASPRLGHLEAGAAMSNRYWTGIPLPLRTPRASGSTKTHALAWVLAVAFLACAAPAPRGRRSAPAAHGTDDRVVGFSRDLNAEWHCDGELTMSASGCSVFESDQHHRPGADGGVDERLCGRLPPDDFLACGRSTRLCGVLVTCQCK